MEQQLGSLILATDISRQNEFLLTFREHLDNQDLDLQLASHRHFMLQVCCTPHRALQDVKPFSRVFLTSERHSRPSDRSKVCGRLQSVPCLGAEPTVE